MFDINMNENILSYFCFQIRAGAIKESTCAIILRGVLKGIDFLHSNGFIHQNIKASKIFIGENGEIKLSGLETSSIEASIRRVASYVGTPYWMSPESILEDSCTSKIDNWCLGITILELLFGNPPFYNVHPMRTIFLIASKEPPRLQGNSFSDEFKDFVHSCLTKDYKERPTTKQLLNHPFILQAKDDISCFKSLIDDYLEFSRIVMDFKLYYESDEEY